MRSVHEDVFGNAITSRMEGEPVRIMRMRSRPSAIPPCGGAPKRNASRRKPNFARASSGPIPRAVKRRDCTSGRWIRGDLDAQGAEEIENGFCFSGRKKDEIAFAGGERLAHAFNCRVVEEFLRIR